VSSSDPCKTRCVPQLCTICYLPTQRKLQFGHKVVRGKRALGWLWRANCGNKESRLPTKWAHSLAFLEEFKLPWLGKNFQSKPSIQEFPSSSPIKCVTDCHLQASSFLFVLLLPIFLLPYSRHLHHKCPTWVIMNLNGI
jgi:hypothetical protein